MSTYTSAIDQVQRELDRTRVLYTMFGNPEHEQHMKELSTKLNRLLNEMAEEVTEAWKNIPLCKNPAYSHLYTESDIRCSECGGLLHGTERGRCREHR